MCTVYYQLARRRSLLRFTNMFPSGRGAMVLRGFHTSIGPELTVHVTPDILHAGLSALSSAL